jgi:hypothetical protein
LRLERVDRDAATFRRAHPVRSASGGEERGRAGAAAHDVAVVILIVARKVRAEPFAPM